MAGDEAGILEFQRSGEPMTFTEIPIEVFRGDGKGMSVKRPAWLSREGIGQYVYVVGRTGAGLLE